MKFIADASRSALWYCTQYLLKRLHARVWNGVGDLQLTLSQCELQCKLAGLANWVQ